MFYDGELVDDPKRYVGGSVMYVNFCDSDEISLLEINVLLVECGAIGGCYNLWYKLPGTTMDKGLFVLDTDDELMLMCTLLPKSRYVEIYVASVGPLEVLDERQKNHEEIHMEDPFPDSTQREIDTEEESRNLEGIRKDHWEMQIDPCYTKDLYMKLYNCTLEPIVGLEFWQHTNEPRPRPPNMRIASGRSKKKRSTKNDIPQDPTKLSKVGIIVNCTYCKARGHNVRTCFTKKNDMARKAADEGQVPNLKKSTVVCKTCKKECHNSRTCASKNQQQQNGQQASAMGQQGQQTLPNMMQQRQGSK